MKFLFLIVCTFAAFLSSSLCGATLLDLNREVLFKQFNYSNETTYLDLAGKNISSVDEFTFYGLISIDKIRLSRNSISVIHPNTFNSLLNLEYLSLGY